MGWLPKAAISSRRSLAVAAFRTGSPLAAAVLAQRGGAAVDVRSAGVRNKWVGQAAHPAMIAAAARRGYDLTGHRGVQVSPDLTGFTRSLPTVYVTGGAQGSAQINGMMREILPWLLTHANVIHQCGAASLEVSRQYADTLPADLRARYWVDAFVGPELPDVFALAGVVVARSGAGTIAELIALGKPSVLIPLATSAGNEQEHNALYLQEAGAAVALVRDDANAGQLRRSLEKVITSPELREQMTQRAAALGRPDAAARLVYVLLKAGLDDVR